MRLLCVHFSRDNTKIIRGATKLRFSSRQFLFHPESIRIAQSWCRQEVMKTFTVSWLRAQNSNEFGANTFIVWRRETIRLMCVSGARLCSQVCPADIFTHTQFPVIFLIQLSYFLLKSRKTDEVNENEEVDFIRSRAYLSKNIKPQGTARVLLFPTLIHLKFKAW